MNVKRNFNAKPARWRRIRRFGWLRTRNDLASQILSSIIIIFVETWKQTSMGLTALIHNLHIWWRISRSRLSYVPWLCLLLVCPKLLRILIRIPKRVPSAWVSKWRRLLSCLLEMSWFCRRQSIDAVFGERFGSHTQSFGKAFPMARRPTSGVRRKHCLDDRHYHYCLEWEKPYRMRVVWRTHSELNAQRND